MRPRAETGPTLSQGSDIQGRVGLLWAGGRLTVFYTMIRGVKASAIVPHLSAPPAGGDMAPTLVRSLPPAEPRSLGTTGWA